MDKYFEAFTQNLKVFGRRAGHNRDYVANASSSYKRAREFYPSGVRTSAMFIIAANEFIGRKGRQYMAAVAAKAYSDIYYGRCQNIAVAVKAAAEDCPAKLEEVDLGDISQFITRQITQRTADANRNNGVVNAVLRKLR